MTQAANGGLLDRLKTWRILWRDSSDVGRDLNPEAVSPDLSGDDAETIRRHMHACLERRGGEVSARSRAAALGRAYLRLEPEGRARFLSLLAKDFDTDLDAVDQAAAVLRLAERDDERKAAEQRLREVLEPPRLHLLTQFNALPEGVKFLVDMRADLLSLLREMPELETVERDLKTLLAAWFDVGFLELRRITWRSPAAILEKIIAYEAVHAIESWDDLKNRLDSDRRLYAFFHPRMPDEPLIFVEVALMNGMASNIQELLDENAPVGNPEAADTAIFYSISNAQKGLAGISFGNFLIKRVVDNLGGEFKNLRTFATLSPVPGFRRWLDRVLAEGKPGLLSAQERRALAAATPRKGGKGTLKALLSQEDWHQDPVVVDALRAPLMRLCARYVLQEKHANGKRALDPVAHFHLTNGARVERLNWMGDVSPKGLAQSAGIMINYLYKLSDIEANHEAYTGQGKVAQSNAVRALVKV